MGFWDFLEENEEPSGSFESGGGKIELIPDGTSLLAVIDEAKWDRDRDGNRYISLRWSVLAPEELKNRKVYQKIWAADPKPNTKPDKIEAARDKAQRMFSAIDFNAGGKHREKRIEPTDESMMMYLTNKPMVIKVLVWELEDRSTGSVSRGNWVGAVDPKEKPVSTKEDIDAGAAQMAKAAQKATKSRELDDEIPF